MAQARTIANFHYPNALAGQDGTQRKFEPTHGDTKFPTRVATHLDPYIYLQFDMRMKGPHYIKGGQPYMLHSKGISGPTSRVRHAVSKRKPLSSSFPFNQCTDPHLRETRKSLEDGVKIAIHHFSNYKFQLFHINGNGLLRNAPVTLPGKCHSDMPSGQRMLPCGSLGQPLPLSPILVRSSEPSREHVIVLLKRALHSCIARKMRISDAHMADPMVQLSLHYATNVFLQDFKSPSTRALCDDIIRDNHSGELNDTTTELLGNFLDKFEELALDAYEDVLIESVTNSQTVLDNGTVDNPQFLPKFKNIWKLDPSNFLEFNVRVFIEEFSDGENRPYSYNSYRESFLVKLGEAGLAMNILKASYYYREEILRIPQQKISPENIVDMMEFSQLRESLLDMLETAADSAPLKLNGKILRFANGWS